MTEKMTATDENKHVTLNRAINRLDDVLQQAEELHKEIIYDGRDDECSNEDAKKSYPPSLEDVLNNGASRIETHIEEIAACLEKIRISLF